MKKLIIILTVAFAACTKHSNQFVIKPDKSCWQCEVYQNDSLWRHTDTCIMGVDTPYFSTQHHCLRGRPQN